MVFELPSDFNFTAHINIQTPCFASIWRHIFFIEQNLVIRKSTKYQKYTRFSYSYVLHCIFIKNRCLCKNKFIFKRNRNAKKNAKLQLNIQLSCKQHVICYKNKFKTIHILKRTRSIQLISYWIKMLIFIAWLEILLSLTNCFVYSTLRKECWSQFRDFTRSKNAYTQCCHFINV